MRRLHLLGSLNTSIALSHTPELPQDIQIHLLTSIAGLNISKIIFFILNHQKWNNLDPNVGNSISYNSYRKALLNPI